MNLVVVRDSLCVMLAYIGVCLLASCSSSLEGRLGELVLAKDRWVAQAGERHYSYQIEFGTNSAAAYTVLVTEPGSLREDWLENPPCSDLGVCRVDPTMRELYQLVLDLTGEHLREGGKLEVVYDEVLGYPKRIFWDDHSGSHSARIITVSNIVFVEV